MMLTRLIAVTAFAVTAAVATAGTASAAPAPVDPHNAPTLETDILPGIHYTASIVDKSVVLTTDAGSLTTQGNQFQVLDAAGNLVAGFPLTYSRDGKEWPVAAQIDGRSATLTPSTDPATATPLEDAALPLQPTALDVQSPEFTAAIVNFGTEVALGIGMGSLIGTAIGAGIGCIAGGALVGTAVGVPTIGTLAVPGFLGGCLVTGAAAGAIGAVAGTIIVGGPVAVASALQFYDAVNAPVAEPVAG
ncbi:hypothetical protein JWS13_15580 [Rhodococcus pseudokoreensis]|uniref:DUF8020 domain-containing protein n=2 Tax=Rhodococcus pseudokoreensis TaxID=2811421 RepID=A0A974ZYS5_9NOCA|nr:hypothetical protein JWS13_15580 [Rhodococcus pseudokoreensis]